MLINSVRADEINEEIAAALMMANDTNHPTVLEYVDDEYDLPEGITPEAGETFDSIIETWELDPKKEEVFGTRDGYYHKGEIVSYNDTIYEINSDNLIFNGGTDGLEPLDTAYTVAWGVGVINKGRSDEKVNRLIYPDATYISLINFNGVSGLG